MPAVVAGYVDASLIGWESSVPALMCSRCGATVRRGRGDGAGPATELHDEFHAAVDRLFAAAAAHGIPPYA